MLIPLRHWRWNFRDWWRRQDHEAWSWVMVLAVAIIVVVMLTVLFPVKPV